MLFLIRIFNNEEKLEQFYSLLGIHGEYYETFKSFKKLPNSLLNTLAVPSTLIKKKIMMVEIYIFCRCTVNFLGAILRNVADILSKELK